MFQNRSGTGKVLTNCCCGNAILALTTGSLMNLVLVVSEALQRLQEALQNTTPEQQDTKIYAQFLYCNYWKLST